MLVKLRQCSGFTYLGLLILIAIISIAATATVQVGALAQRRAAEEELLFVGMTYRQALTSYANATPAGLPRHPKALEDLLKDPRYPNTRRHLRRLYPDPITGKAEWGLLLAIDGRGITGIYSLSAATPIKIGGFEQELVHFSGKTSYQDWKFSILPAAYLHTIGTPRDGAMMLDHQLRGSPTCAQEQSAGMQQVCR